MAKILIADDSDAIRLVLKDILGIGEHEVIAEAIDGQESIDLYKETKPDLILLDLAMPKKDGLTVVKEIIEFDSIAKIILITASDDQKIIKECIDGGAYSYVSKPFDFKNVLKAIEDTLAK
ncbi:MAG: response regulator [Nitrosopumilus sp.]|jgi:two-component system chemotaxis response regulator CheY|nr:response regulator [Nitrosopumilus sp.]